MNNLLLILGIIALSNGNISLFDNKTKTNNKTAKSIEDLEKNSLDRERKHLGERSSRAKNVKNGKKVKKVRRKNNDSESSDDLFRFDVNDINKGLKLMELSDEDLERGMEIITRTKKYMTTDERKILVKLESMLDLVRGIKKLSGVDDEDDEMETNFFRSMDDDDKKNMMIKEILEVFPEKRKESIEKAIDMKKKIDLFAELFLPDDFGEGGFSLSSLANINNLGSISNLKLLGNLLRGEDNSYVKNNSSKYTSANKVYEEYEEDEYEEYDYEEYEDYEDE